MTRRSKSKLNSSISLQQIVTSPQKIQSQHKQETRFTDWKNDLEKALFQLNENIKYFSYDVTKSDWR